MQALAPIHQLVPSSRLDESALVEDGDHVRVANRRQTMRDQQNSDLTT
jgi:hypothetical protein